MHILGKKLTNSEWIYRNCLLYAKATTVPCLQKAKANRI